MAAFPLSPAECSVKDVHKFRPVVRHVDARENLARSESSAFGWMVTEWPVNSDTFSYGYLVH